MSRIDNGTSINKILSIPIPKRSVSLQHERCVMTTLTVSCCYTQSIDAAAVM